MVCEMEKRNNEKNNEELKRLYRLLYEKDKEFESAKLKRVLLTILGFAVLYFILLFSIWNPTGLDVLAVVGIAIVLAGFHFFVNACVFLPLAQKGRDESEALSAIRKRISELER